MSAPVVIMGCRILFEVFSFSSRSRTKELDLNLKYSAKFIVNFAEEYKITKLFLPAL